MMSLLNSLIFAERDIHHHLEKYFGTTLLEQVHDQVSDSIKVNVADKKYIILSQDGWSNNSNTPFLAHSFFDVTSSQFLSIKDSGSNKKTAEYCADLAEEAIIGIYLSIKVLIHLFTVYTINILSIYLSLYLSIYFIYSIYL